MIIKMDSIMKGCISRILSLSCRDFWVTEFVKFGLGLGLGYSLLLWIMIKSGRSSGSSGESGLILQFVPSPLRHRYAGQPSFLLFFFKPKMQMQQQQQLISYANAAHSSRDTNVSCIYHWHANWLTAWLPCCLLGKFSTLWSKGWLVL